MRRALAFALAPVALGALGPAFAACGGPAFTAGAVVDAGSSPIDGPQTADAGSSFCALEAGTHTFCDDFDGPPLTALWIVDRTNSLTIAQDDSSIYVSPPNSFEAQIGLNTGASLHARLGKQLTVSSKIAMAFALHLDTVGVKPANGGGTTIVLLALGADYAVGLAADDAMVSAFEDITQPDGGVVENSTAFLATDTITGTWVQVALDLDVHGARLTGAVNGAALSLPLTPPTSAVPNVYLGLTQKNIVAQTEAHYDNVTIDGTP